eukprot:scaffold121729_cov57-Phaeocystis_antarctica.AAC.1
MARASSHSPRRTPQRSAPRPRRGNNCSPGSPSSRFHRGVADQLLGEHLQPINGLTWATEAAAAAAAAGWATVAAAAWATEAVAAAAWATEAVAAVGLG